MKAVVIVASTSGYLGQREIKRSDSESPAGEHGLYGAGDSAASG